MRTANTLIILGIVLLVWFVTTAVLVALASPSDPLALILMPGLIPALAAAMIAGGILMRRRN